MSDPILLGGEAGLREFRKALIFACNDPGHFVGYKGDRSLGEWQADALLAGPLAQLQESTALPLDPSPQGEGGGE